MHIQNKALKLNLSNAENKTSMQTDKSSFFDISVNQNSLVVCLEVKRKNILCQILCIPFYVFCHFPSINSVLRLKRRVHSSFHLHTVLYLWLFWLQPVKFIDYKPLELSKCMWLTLYIFWKMLLVACTVCSLQVQFVLHIHWCLVPGPVSLLYLLFESLSQKLRLSNFSALLKGSKCHMK